MRILSLHLYQNEERNGLKAKNDFHQQQKKEAIKNLIKINIKIKYYQRLHTFRLYGGSSHPKYSRNIRFSRM